MLVLYGERLSIPAMKTTEQGLMERSMHPVIRIVLFISLVLVSSGGTAPGQQASASLATPNPAPTPIPLGKVALEAQSALASLQEIDAGVSRDQSSADGIARTLLDLTNEIDARIAGDTRLLTTSQSIDLRYWLKITWQNFGDSLLVSARELTQHATSLEVQLARLDQLNKTWQATNYQPKLLKPTAEVGELIRAIAKIGLIFLPAAFLANIFGYVNLGNLLGIIFLRSVYIAFLLYGVIRMRERFPNLLRYE